MGKLEGLEDILKFFVSLARVFSHPHSLADVLSGILYLLLAIAALVLLGYLWHCFGKRLARGLRENADIILIAGGVICLLSILYLILKGEYAAIIILGIVNAVAYGIYWEHRKAVNHCEQGNTSLEQGDFWTAIESYDVAIKSDAEYAQAFYNRGLAKRAIGDSAGAEKDFKNAIKKDSSLAKLSAPPSLGPNTEIPMASFIQKRSQNPEEEQVPFSWKWVFVVAVLVNSIFCLGIVIYDIIGRLTSAGAPTS